MKNSHSHLDVRFEVKSLEMKDVDGQQFGFFTGYASVFNNKDSVRDVVARGAFTKTLTEHKPKLHWQHDLHEVIGSLPSIKEDDHGLFVEARVNLGTETGKKAYALLKAGDLDSMSIGYTVVDSEIDRKTQIRTLKELKLWEISLVSIPANVEARITSVKTITEIESAKSLAEIEDVLQEKGFSQRESLALVSKIKAFSKKSESSGEDGQRDFDPNVLLSNIKNLTDRIKPKEK